MSFDFRVLRIEDAPLYTLYSKLITSQSKCRNDDQSIFADTSTTLSIALRNPLISLLSLEPIAGLFAASVIAQHIRPRSFARWLPMVDLRQS